MSDFPGQDQSVLKAVGLDFKEDYIVPSALVNDLKNQPDLEMVEHSFVDPIRNKLTDDPEESRYIPDPD